MDTQNKKNTEDNKTAVAENKITPENLLREIISILKEYFIASFKLENGAIKMHFLNGADFRLTVSEVIC